MAKRFLVRMMIVCVSAGLLSGCAGTPVPEEKAPFSREQTYRGVEVNPLASPGVFPVPEEEARKLSTALSPARQGLASWKDMSFALEQSLAYVRKKPAGDKAFLGASEFKITYGEMERVLTRLRELLPVLDAEPERLATEFEWVRIGPDFGFTGYYEPELLASPVRTERFKYPLYRVPSDLKKKKRKRAYYSRHDIDCKGALRGRRLELAWVENPVDIFMLQIQGSGRLRYEDGTIRSVLYAGQNGHRYVSLGRVMIDRGIFTREEVNMPAIRRWLAAHPEQQRELLDTNPSYVFFKLGTKQGSYGSMGRVLTPWVSVATDRNILPHGALTLMNLKLPDENGEHQVPFNSLLLPQDTGGAIRRNRVDLFCGNGSQAMQTSGYLDTKGAVYVLLPRERGEQKPERQVAGVNRKDRP